MAKLVRKTQKIFASGSAQNQVTSFGSIKAGAADYTKDVAEIQTEAFEGGWSSAVQDDYAPYRQDRNAVDFVTTSQLAYVFQEGLPEYDAGTTYYKGSWVKGDDGDAFSIYESLSDDNIGNALSDEEKWEKKSFGGGLEIGDIGIAPLGINEAQNKRRYLNGQVISQAQFVSFTNKLKSIIQTYPSIATSETNWQATITNSKLGQCGKFVIDDNAGTIRLPKVVNIQGLQDLALMGSIKAESLPNITGKFDTDTGIFSPSGVFSSYMVAGRIGQQGTNNNGVSFDASRSSSTYQNNAPVQQEAIQYPYFIQVATGVEESIDVTREIELNNPFFFGMSQYFESEPKNASWLISNGAFHSGATYVSFYEWLLKIYNGTEIVDGVSVKASTDTYGDYDYVINTADTTFRLPLLDGSESLPSGSYIDLELGASGDTYVAPANGYVLLSRYATAQNQYCQLLGNGYTPTIYALGNQSLCSVTIPVNKGQRFVANYTTTTKDLFRFHYAKCNGSLYFYVGETIQDANVIAASQVLTDIANLKSYVVGIPDYTASIDWSSAGTYTAPSSGWIMGFIRKSGGPANATLYVNNVLVTRAGCDTASNTYWYPINIFIEKGQIYKAEYGTSAINGCIIKFFPCKGAN